VGRHVRRHTNRDPTRAVGEQEREGTGKNERFL
jgi:hypothetical protein